MNYGPLIGIAIVGALAYRAAVVNQQIVYDHEVDRRVKKYRKPNISGQRKIKYVQGRSKERSHFGLPTWEIGFEDGTTEIFYKNEFPSNYVKERS